MLTFKQALRSIVTRMGIYLDLIERRDDPRYRTVRTHIGANVSLGDVFLEGYNSLDYDVKIQGNVRLGLCSTLGHHTVIQGGDVSIGRYCQIAPCVSIYAQDHPVEYMTIYVNKRLFDGVLQTQSILSPVEIGHDVWLGHGVIVLKGVKIGNGAVVGAGSVVTADIQPYSIAVGNPARTIRKRFDDEIIDLLQQLEWWQNSPDELSNYKQLFQLNFNQNREQALLMLQNCLERKAQKVTL